MLVFCRNLCVPLQLTTSTEMSINEDLFVQRVMRNRARCMDFRHHKSRTDLGLILWQHCFPGMEKLGDEGNRTALLLWWRSGSEGSASAEIEPDLAAISMVAAGTRPPRLCNQAAQQLFSWLLTVCCYYSLPSKVSRLYTQFQFAPRQERSQERGEVSSFSRERILQFSII